MIKLLTVDDEKGMTDLLYNFFHNRGFYVSVAHSGEEITIPKGFAIDDVPNNYSKEAPYLKTEVKYRIRGDVLIREICAEWRMLSISKSEYDNLKAMLDEFHAHATKKIIIKKL